ncbi:hypothetical protein [Labrys sp. (in: a-proteobacteria)]|uniref:hypothetical protein n=1 Tax=Labrys sp. (in: a-proteobacteria) TaxID=1917972 RepID=UPI0039E4ABD5
MPKQSKTALPKYVRARRMKNGALSYYFEVPSWARQPAADDPRGPCKLDNETLPSVFAAMRERAALLIAAFDSWRTQGAADIVPARAERGTFDWMVADYKASDKYTGLSRSQKENHEYGFGLVGNYVLKDGRRLGALPLADIHTGVTERLHEALLYVEVLDDDGKPVVDEKGAPVKRERRTTINHAMKSCRRAWFVAHRRNPKIVPAANPFSKMGLKEKHEATPTATYDEYRAFVDYCDSVGSHSIATAAMIAWEWWQRMDDIMMRLTRDDYRPKNRPGHAQVVHNKTNELVWIPLFDSKGAPLYPELMARMDRMVADRIGGGPLILRDKIDPRLKAHRPWVINDRIDDFRKHVKKLILAAGLREELSFRSFRHGGLTEGGDAELTDAEIRAQSRQKSNVLPTYVKATEKQLIKVAQKRRATRKDG